VVEHEPVESLKIVVSDFHLGKGHFLPDGLPNLMEDFHQDDKFAELLDYYAKGSGRHTTKEVELVINGDFFDYLTVDVSGRYPDAMFESIAKEATELICAGHPIVIDAMRRFAATPGCRIRYQLGNHDPAIVWPAVQRTLCEAIGAQIDFSFDAYEFEDVRIEHGHQREVAHQFDVNQLTLPAGPMGRKEPIINFPFGCFFVTQFVTNIRVKRPYIGQVVPFRLYLRWAFWNDFWFALTHGFFVAAFFIKMRFIRHPTRFSRISKTLRIMREVFSPPKQEHVARRLLKHSNYRVIIMGHNHEAMIRTYPGGKQYVNSGTWTEFTSFDPSMMGRHMIRSYVLLEKPADKPWRATLRQWHGRHAIEETLNW
jgi:UDP-2,3-diacylglucosamine pyrophosphatase LpxH